MYFRSGRARNPVGTLDGAEAGQERSFISAALDEGVNRVAISGDGRHADFARLIAHSERLSHAARAALGGFAIRRRGIVDGQGDVAYAVAMDADMIADGMIGRKRRGQNETDFFLLQNVAGAIAHAGFRTAVSRQFHAEAGPVIVRGLTGVADVKLDVVGSVQRKKIGSVRRHSALLTAAYNLLHVQLLQ